MFHWRNTRPARAQAAPAPTTPRPSVHVPDDHGKDEGRPTTEKRVLDLAAVVAELWRQTKHDYIVAVHEAVINQSTTLLTTPEIASVDGAIVNPVNLLIDGTCQISVTVDDRTVAKKLIRFFKRLPDVIDGSEIVDGVMLTIRILTKSELQQLFQNLPA